MIQTGNSSWGFGTNGAKSGVDGEEGDPVCEVDRRYPYPVWPFSGKRGSL